MRRFKKFSEFLEEKTAGLDYKAKTTIMADYTAKTPDRPGKNGKYPNQPDNTGYNMALPYANKADDVGLVMAEPDGATPLAMGKTPNLTPANSASLGVKPAARPEVHKSSKKQLKELFDNTSGLSDADFVQHLMEGKANERPAVSMVHDLHGDSFTPHPHEAIGYICSLMHNPKMVSRLVREVKRHGHMPAFVAELMDHPEFYDEAVKMMGDKDEGSRVTDRFAKTMADHHNAFRKEAGLNESRRPFQRYLRENVSAPVFNSSEEEDPGISSPSDDVIDNQPDPGNSVMQNPGGYRDEPGSQQGDSGGQMDVDGPIGPDFDPQNSGLGDDSGNTGRFDKLCADGKCGLPGAEAAYNTVQSVKKHFN